MHLSDSDIGQNIQRARYQRGLTQAELATAVGLDRTAISRIEAGARSLAATELARVAAALDAAVPDLLQPAPVRPHAPSLARMLMRAAAVTANDEPQLAWFADLIEQASPAAAAAALSALPPRLHHLPAAAAGELAARWARRRMALGPLAPLHGLSGALARLGIPVVLARFPSASRLAGCALTLPGGLSAVLVNANHPPARRRFTVAHELAHLLFDTESLVSACDAGEIRPGPRSRPEQRADAFAAAFLLPRHTLTPLAAPPLDLEPLHALEAAYGVSHAAAVHRLHELRLLSDEQARVLRTLGRRPRPTRPQGPPARTADTAPKATAPPFRLAGESLARLLGDAGARRAGDHHGYEVVADAEVVP
ncbi:MAG TPA: XRE family transcriptional regulator [Dehalococcoidia bacterium]|nr:XRE family transcriptional regulator [Dehalococcoidia bacterium]